MKLRFKILLLILPLQAIGMLLLGFSAYQELNDTAKKFSYAQIHALIGQSESNIKDILHGAHSNIDLIAQSEILRNYALADDEYMRYQLFQPSLLELFKSYQRAYQHYFEIRYLTMDGYEDTRSVNTSVLNQSDEEGDSLLFKWMRQNHEEQGSYILPHPDTGKYALFIYKKIYLRQTGIDAISDKAEQRGFLVVSIDLSFLEEMVGKYRVGRSGGIFFIADHSEVLYAPQGLLQSNRLSTSVFAKLMMQSDKDEISEVMVAGTKVHTLVRPVQGQLYMVAWLPDSELTENSQHLALQVAVIMILAFLLTTAILYYVLSRILIRPVLKLNEHVGLIGQGQLEHVIDLEADDEIGQLGYSLNEMTNKLKLYQQKITYLAHHDELTGLPNRYTFNDHLRLALSEAARYEYKVAVLMIDLDHFKNVNDTLGHPTGDALLSELSKRLYACIRETDVFSNVEQAELCRLGGDEFTIMLKHVVNNIDAALVAQRILHEIEKPFLLQEQQIFQQASIGITLYPDDGHDVESLLKNADMALYHAKNLGRKNYQFYSSSMNQATQARLHLENRLRLAVQASVFKLYYQPVIDAKTGKIVSAEALIRWWDDGVFMPPDQFIPIAEEAGLINDIGRWVLNQACVQCQAWHEQGFTIRMAVNVSGKQFMDEHLHLKIRTILENTGLLATQLEVELTETSLLNADTEVVAMISKLRSMGVSVALDDFGTGYSSITYLKRFPISKLKIDKSFVMDMDDSNDNKAIVNAIVAISKSLNLDVTAEGVEKETHKEYLTSIECDTLQGYFFSPPVPAEKFMDLLLKYNSAPFTSSN